MHDFRSNLSKKEDRRVFISNGTSGIHSYVTEQIRLLSFIHCIKHVSNYNKTVQQNTTLVINSKAYLLNIVYMTRLITKNYFCNITSLVVEHFLSLNKKTSSSLHIYRLLSTKAESIGKLLY